MSACMSMLTVIVKEIKKPLFKKEKASQLPPCMWTIPISFSFLIFLSGYYISPILLDERFTLSYDFLVM